MTFNTCDCGEELERLKQERDKQIEESERQRKARRQELSERYEAAQRSASNWREALVKQASLYKKEATQFPDPDENGIDSFAIAGEACKKAAQVWDEIAGQKREEIEALQAQIQAIHDSIRLDTVAKVRENYAGQPGFDHIESLLLYALEEGGEPEDWLNW